MKQFDQQAQDQPEKSNHSLKLLQPRSWTCFAIFYVVKDSIRYTNSFSKSCNATDIYPVPVVWAGKKMLDHWEYCAWDIIQIQDEHQVPKFRYQLNRNNQHIRNQLKEPVCACAYRTPSALTSWTQNETIFVRTNLSVKKCNPLWNKISLWMFTSFNST